METFNYTISVKKNLNEDERKVIMKLYQPILGVQSTAIYFTLIEEKEVLNKLKTLTFNEKRLMKLTKLTNKKLMEGIHKLEGLKLLKRRYQKSKNLINFQIQPPIDPAAFFDNMLLNDMLIQALGEQDYEVSRYCFLDEELIDDDLEDLTVSFVEAFPEQTNEMTLKNLINQKNSLKTPLNPDLINFSNLELELLKHDLPLNALTKTTKKILVDNASFFNLNQELLVDSIVEAYDFKTKTIDNNLLKITLKTAWSQATLIEKVNQFDQMKDEFRSMAPVDYLHSLLNQVPSPAFLLIIKNLTNKYGLSNENINCLLNYSSLKNNGKIIDKYIYKIAATLNKLEITALDDVIDHLKNAYSYATNKVEVDLINDEQRLSGIENDLLNQEFDQVIVPEPNKYLEI